MPMTFDATLKDLAREHPRGFLTEFDRPPALPIKLLNVDLSTVTRAADFVVALGDPPVEVVDLEFQSSAAAWKHADGYTRKRLRTRRRSCSHRPSCSPDCECGEMWH
ncbi:MAG TPA: hypothetical protein VFI31_11770 [Pirellulales bacterium]|nr:hypothetical protein [Pirellulales bacterium]